MRAMRDELCEDAKEMLVTLIVPKSIGFLTIS